MDEPTVVVGIATKAHGIRGEVAIQTRSDNPDRWSVGAVVIDEDGTEFTIATARGGGGRLFVRFDGVEDRNAAETLRGRTFVVPLSWLPPLPEGEYWPHQLQGANVVTESGRDLGRIDDVVANPANDLWVAVDDGGHETFVPAIADVVVQVDLAAHRIVVRDVPGLTGPDDEG
ncbi:MAG TPA: ribosome maturation factor RimM [Actinomycetota bacterium]|nr:ribosome maturation factor RimM [Actinomycetota bacterium]